MATDQKDQKEQRPFWQTAVQGVITALLPSVIASFTSIGWDYVFFLFTIGLILSPLSVYYFGRRLTKKSRLLTSPDTPAEIPALPSRARRWLFGVAALGVVQFILARWFWDDLFAIASLDDFKSDRKFLQPNGVSRFSPPAAVYLPGKYDREHDRAWRAFTLTINKTHVADLVRITEVRMVIEPTEYEWNPLKGVAPTNLEKPFCFRVFVPKDDGPARTVLIEKGKESTGGDIVLDNQAHPFALCRFDIVAEGEADIYLAHVEVDVCDRRGKRKQTLKTAKLFAFARPWSPPPA
jgi:hypothetical protein